MGDHPAVAKARRYIEEFNKGNPEAVGDYFAEDVVWRVGGKHPLSGEYRGKEELLEYFAKVKEQTGGTLTLEAESILASDHHTALFTRVRAQRDGKSLDVVLAQILANGPDGRWTEYWALADNQSAVDAFWA